MAKVMECILVPDDETLPKIHLDDGKLVTLGRSPATQVRCKTCARQQVQVIANYEKKQLQLTQIGKNPSRVSGRLLEPQKTCILNPKEKFSLLRNSFGYEVQFLSQSSQDQITSKRRYEDIDSCTEAEERKRMKPTLHITMQSVLLKTPYRVIKSLEEPNYNGWTDFRGLLIYTSDNANPSTKVVIFSNQLGIGNKMVNKESFKKKITNIINSLGVPVQAYIATNRDIYRKPFIGMWQYLIWKANNAMTIDLETSFFVGAGKSTFVRNYLSPRGYVDVNRDKLKSWQKCVSVCTVLLDRGSSVVIDNTNPDKFSRKRYIDCARSKKIPIRCFIFTTLEEIAKHNNKIREATAEEGYQSVTEIAFNTFKFDYLLSYNIVIFSIHLSLLCLVF
ncbi:uncharacterized protein TRIADDRAFT_59893 [Trichoplax adhaerens]|uniref:PNK FHA domain-containing protein n=1 Tax=Trichoplax adhaerens TaxID=10228 RepID=B3S6Q9_TRIAD|nr:hypothetical protein TRIADDRAFT_59893 [Trichoplax adhaerens]EDV21661.1 hypothetical protein TRIADDRAFT_59893 [Trichoplax adhaerens]|eukprot:XP_002115809.1 hypothetical protein TRIADDRAFT_59893 [Trichoplax adhaerens]